jgi:polyketide synthase 5
VGDPIAFPVAVIGIARPLPRILKSRDALWEALLRGDDLITQIAAHGWDAEEYHDPGFVCEFFGRGERRSGVSRAVDY